MAKWIDIGHLADFPPGSKRCLDADGQSVVICHLDKDALGAAQGQAELCAIVNICPHAGLPLGDGELTGAVLTCPYHGYAFNVATGRNIDFPDDTPTTTLPLRVVDDRVQIDVDAT